jgi:GNAT superfamily N-acetyltransferase
MLVSLSDGTQLFVRHVCPGDKDLIAKAWLQLSEQSQRRRFLAAKPRLTVADLRYLTEVDQENHVALIAVNAGDPSQMVGAGRFVRLADDPETAEVAVTVADHLHGRGVGKQLGILLADEARRRGVKRFSASILSDNVPALRLMAAMSERLESHAAGPVRDVVADLAA